MVEMDSHIYKMRRILRGNDIDYSASCILFTGMNGLIQMNRQMLSKLDDSRLLALGAYHAFVVSHGVQRRDRTSERKADRRAAESVQK